MRMISCIRVLCILCDIPVPGRNLVPNEISLIAELFFTLIRSGCATLSVCATLGASVPTVLFNEDPTFELVRTVILVR